MVNAKKNQMICSFSFFKNNIGRYERGTVLYAIIHTNIQPMKECIYVLYRLSKSI